MKSLPASERGERHARLELEAGENATMFADDAKFVHEGMANRTLPGRGMGGPGSEYFSSMRAPLGQASSAPSIPEMFVLCLFVGFLA